MSNEFIGGLTLDVWTEVAKRLALEDFVQLRAVCTRFYKNRKFQDAGVAVLQEDHLFQGSTDAFGYGLGKIYRELRASICNTESDTPTRKEKIKAIFAELLKYKRNSSPVFNLDGSRDFSYNRVRRYVCRYHLFLGGTIDDIVSTEKAVTSRIKQNHIIRICLMTLYAFMFLFHLFVTNNISVKTRLIGMGVLIAAAPPCLFPNEVFRAVDRYALGFFSRLRRDPVEQLLLVAKPVEEDKKATEKETKKNR